jgi:sorting nexin-1/2
MPRATMSTGASPTLANLDLETDGASPWGDERSINTSTPPISLPHDDTTNIFRDAGHGMSQAFIQVGG